MKNKKIQIKGVQDLIDDKIKDTADLAPTIHFVPRTSESLYKCNDIYVKPKKKAQIVFTENDLKMPSLIEAIQGKFKLLPVFKKEGPVWVEMTSYPSSITEALS